MFAAFCRDHLIGSLLVRLHECIVSSEGNKRRQETWSGRKVWARLSCRHSNFDDGLRVR